MIIALTVLTLIIALISLVLIFALLKRDNGVDDHLISDKLVTYERNLKDEFAQNRKETLNGLMAFPNLVALILLSGIVARETKKFFEKLEKEKD